MFRIRTSFVFGTAIFTALLASQPTMAQMMAAAVERIEDRAATFEQTRVGPGGSNFESKDPAPMAPTALSFTAVTQLGMTLNWTDSPDDTFYTVYRSADGVDYTFDGTAGQNAPAYNATGLKPGTKYFWNVYAVSDGALSTALSGSQPTSPAANITSFTSGVWSAPGTWTGGVVPGLADNVTIKGVDIVTVDTAATALSVTVQSGAVLEFEATTAQTLTVLDAVTIDLGGILRSNPTGTQTGHFLTIGGNLANNGMIDFSTNGNTAGAGIRFEGAGDSTATFGAASNTDLKQTQGMTIDKAVNTAVVSFNPGGNLTVLGANAAGFLTIQTGIFKMDGTGTFSNPLFNTATYTIFATGGLWMNNPNATVVGLSGSPTLIGKFQVTQGTFNIGTASDDSMGFNSGANLLVEGGAINVTGRFGVASSTNDITYNQTSGTVTTCTVGNTSTTLACFDLGTGVGTTNISGGNIVIQTASTAVIGPRDYRNQSGLTGTTTVTGGTVQFGNANTPAAIQAFDAAGVFPNVAVTNTTANHTVTMLPPAVFNNVARNITINAGTTFNIGNNVFLFNGTTLTNNGTFTGNGASTNFVTFLTTSPQTITGTGTFTAAITSFAIQSDAGLILSPTNQITVGALRLFSGSVTNANKFTLGNGGATAGVVQIGNTTTPTACGTFDVPFTFNFGTGGQLLSYLRCTASRSTGPEINPTRSVMTLTRDDNDVTHTLTVTGGPLTMTGPGISLALTNGVVVTSAANPLIHGPGVATRTTGYVDGPLTRASNAAGAYTFFVGENGFSPVLVNTTAVVAGSTLTVEAFDATLGGFSPATSLSRNWSLTESGDITADLSFTYLDPGDVNGAEAAYRVFRRDGAGINTDMCGAPCVNTGTNTLGPVVGVTTFSRWTGAEAQVPTAAAVSLAGRVTTADGRGIVNAMMTISGGGLPQPRLARTGPFGYYEFTNLEAGQTYIVSIASKRFTFTVPSRPIQLLDSIGDFDFVAEP